MEGFGGLSGKPLERLRDPLRQLLRVGRSVRLMDIKYIIDDTPQAVDNDERMTALQLGIDCSFLDER